MADTKITALIIGIIAIALFAFAEISRTGEPNPVLGAKLSIVGPDEGVFAILSGGTRTLVDVEKVPFRITIVNGGNIPHLKHPDLNQYLPRILHDFEIIGLSAINADAEVFISNENTKLKSLFNIKPIP